MSRRNNQFNAPEPVFNSDYSNIIIIDGIPKVPAKKLVKLKAFIMKTFKVYGEIVECDTPGPDEAAGPKAPSPGYCFLEYKTKASALAAVKAKDKKAFDKKHQMRVNLFTQFDPEAEEDQKYSAPPASEFARETKNYNGWLADDFGRDQLVVRFAKESHIIWNDPVRKVADEGFEMYYDGHRQKEKNSRRGRPGSWTEKYVAWSPKGSYFATFHEQGILIWGGPNFEELARFEHRNVAALDFSPCENFLVTANWKDKKGPQDSDCFIVWDIKKKMNARPGQTGVIDHRGFNRDQSNNWPAFTWSHDDKFFARCGKDSKGEGVISVYQTPTFSLLEKKSIPCNLVQDVQFSPTRNVIAYWVAETKNTPASVGLRELPSRKVIKDKHMFSCSNLQMYWQSSGEYLCVKLTKKKTKKTFTSALELFRLKEKDVPVETIDLEDPEVIGVSWQPKGWMFSVLHASGQNAKPSITFYQVKRKKTVPMYTLTNNDTLVSSSFDRVIWSPSGSNVVLASMQAGKLEFFDVKKKQSIVEQDHFKMTHLYWCPSGRYLLSISAQPLGDKSWAYASENGYKIWTVHGDNLVSVSKETLYQVMWRPRPPTLLSKQQIADTKKSLKKKYWDTFETEMQRIREGNSSAHNRERLRVKDEWRSYRRVCDEQYIAESDARKELRGDLDSDNEDDYTMVETTIQNLISLSETPI